MIQKRENNKWMIDYSGKKIGTTEFKNKIATIHCTQYVLVHGISIPKKMLIYNCEAELRSAVITTLSK